MAGGLVRLLCAGDAEGTTGQTERVVAFHGGGHDPLGLLAHDPALGSGPGRQPRSGQLEDQAADAVHAGGHQPRGGERQTQATRMFLATPHRTAESRLVAPAPMIAEVMMWVVETGACQTNAVV